MAVLLKENWKIDSTRSKLYCTLLKKKKQTSLWANKPALVVVATDGSVNRGAASSGLGVSRGLPRGLRGSKVVAIATDEAPMRFRWGTE